MLVREIMKTNVLTIRPDDALAVAAQTMLWMGLRHLPVVEDRRLLGVISDRDLLRHRAESSDPTPMAIPVREVMSKPPLTVGPDDTVTEAAERMFAHKIGCLPVLVRGELAGMITTMDLLALTVREAYRPSIEEAPLRARDVMTAHPVTSRQDEYVENALARMLMAGVRHMPIVDEDGRICGIVSDRDFRIPPRPPGGNGHLRVADAKLRIADLMTRNVVTVRADAPIGDLIAAFTDYRLNAVPVTDERGHAIGIVSFVDVLQAFNPERRGPTAR